MFRIAAIVSVLCLIGAPAGAAPMQYEGGTHYV